MNVTCLNCGWVHFSYTRIEAEREIARFNYYFDSLTRDEQVSHYGGRKRHENRYEHCMNCGGLYTNFREAGERDCPSGCTINPIIHFNERN